jgi:acid phosphatase (class A)
MSIAQAPRLDGYCLPLIHRHRLMHAPSRRSSRRFVIAVYAILVGIAAGHAYADGLASLAAAPGVRADLVPGYLATDAGPSSLVLLPPPPAWGSSAFALDQAISRASLALRDTERWQLAITDANLQFPAVAGTFSCALNAPISEQATPVLYRLLRRTLSDAGLATSTAKDRYQRRRPFLSNYAPICTPGLEKALMTDGSYPSGHTTIGWTWALILTEIAPERLDAIIARGRAFGDSRLVCNAHWASDVDAGRYLGAVVTARLHADAAFLADLNAAREELAVVRARDLPLTRDCVAESAALAVHLPVSP